VNNTLQHNVLQHDYLRRIAAPDRSRRETGLRTPTESRRRTDVSACRSHDERVISSLLRSSSAQTCVGRFVTCRASGVLRTVFAADAQARLAHESETRQPWETLMRLNYAIVFVSNMSRSVAFYRDVVGLPLKFESPGWSEFNTDGATLALHASKAVVGGPLSEDLPAGHCRPGFSVPDLDAFHRRMVASDVRCLQEPKTTFGARIAQYVDPDGLTISVSEQRAPA
jgi:lactoylglutathione lyase